MNGELDNKESAMIKTCRHDGCKMAAGDGGYCADHEKLSKGAAGSCPHCEAGKPCPKHCPSCVKGKCPVHGKSKSASALSKVARDHRLGNTMADAFLDELHQIESSTGQEKTAIIADIIGYPLGRKAEERGEKRMMPAWTKVLFIPGGIGHELGRWSVYRKKGKVKESASLQDYIKTAAVSKVRYSKYFRHKMRERGITSVTQLTDEEKRKFFNEVDKGYHSKSEKVLGQGPGGQD